MSEKGEEPIKFGREGQPTRQLREGQSLAQGGQVGRGNEGLGQQGTPNGGIRPPRGGSVMSKPQNPPPTSQQGGNSGQS